jgi:hypothetical protein
MTYRPADEATRRRRCASLLLLCAVCGCALPVLEGAAGKPGKKTMTLENLVHVDMYAPSYTTQHPLVCGTGKDFPAGAELLFRNQATGRVVHAVFPEAAGQPADLDGRFALRGRYQGIQNMASYPWKRPASGYRYFVVSAWRHEE